MHAPPSQGSPSQLIQDCTVLKCSQSASTLFQEIYYASSLNLISMTGRQLGHCACFVHFTKPTVYKICPRLQGERDWPDIQGPESRRLTVQLPHYMGHKCQGSGLGQDTSTLTALMPLNGDSMPSPLADSVVQAGYERNVKVTILLLGPVMTTAHLCSFRMEMKSGAAALMCRNMGS